MVKLRQRRLFHTLRMWGAAIIASVGSPFAMAPRRGWQASRACGAYGYATASAQGEQYVSWASNPIEPFQGAAALIYGAAHGIGRAVAREFARRGDARVAIADIDRAGAEAVAAEIIEAGGRAVGLLCDVTSDESVRSAALEAERALGEIDIVTPCSLHHGHGLARGWRIGRSNAVSRALIVRPHARMGALGSRRGSGSLKEEPGHGSFMPRLPMLGLYKL